LRHAVVLASIGWYLMVPPFNPPNYQLRTDLPLSEWWQHQSFDSAADCETAQNDLVNKFASKSKKASGQIAEFWITSAESMAQGHCIASDDPRLKGN